MYNTAFPREHCYANVPPCYVIRTMRVYLIIVSPIKCQINSRIEDILEEHTVSVPGNFLQLKKPTS